MFGRVFTDHTLLHAKYERQQSVVTTKKTLTKYKVHPCTVKCLLVRSTCGFRKHCTVYCVTGSESKNNRQGRQRSNKMQKELSSCQLIKILSWDSAVNLRDVIIRANIADKFLMKNATKVKIHYSLRNTRGSSADERRAVNAAAFYKPVWFQTALIRFFVTF